MKRAKPDSMFLIVVYWLFFAAIILGASTGCIFEDIDGEEKALGVFAMLLCVLLYTLKLIAQFFSKEPADELDEAKDMFV